ncbi:MAG: RING finger protein [Brevinematia bacterium]
MHKQNAKKIPNSNLNSSTNNNTEFTKSKKNLTPTNKKHHKYFDVTYSIDYSKITGTCPICSKHTIYDPSNIVIEGHVFHFECVVNYIKEKFGTESNNKILYTGSNTFGIFWESRDTKKTELLKKVNLKDTLYEYIKANT